MLKKNRFTILLLFITFAAVLLSGCLKHSDNEADTLSNNELTGLPADAPSHAGSDITSIPDVIEEVTVSPITDQPQKAIKGYEAAPSDKPDVTGLPVLPDEEALNNGGLYVKYKGFTYYREYNAESFDSTGLWGDYYPVAGVTKNMMRILEDGTTETAFTDDGTGDIYIYNSRMYLQTTTDYQAAIYSVNLDGSSRKVIGNGEIKGIDEASGTLVCMLLNKDDSSVLGTINSSTEEVKELDLTIPCDEVLAVRDGFIYYLGTEDYEASALGHMKLCRVAVDGSKEELLAESKTDLYDYDSYGTEIPCFQFVDDTIYFSYGGYAGTAYEYQGGQIARVNTDGSDFEILAGNIINTQDRMSDLVNDIFYVAKGNNINTLHYSDYSDYKFTEKAMDLLTGEVTAAKFPIYQEGIPFEFNGGVYVYRNASPVMTNLIPTVDYSSLGFGSQDYYYRIHDIELCGNWVYYRLEANEDNPGASIGWRDGYSRIKTQVIREEKGGGKKEILFEY